MRGQALVTPIFDQNVKMQRMTIHGHALAKARVDETHDAPVDPSLFNMIPRRFSTVPFFCSSRVFSSPEQHRNNNGMTKIRIFLEKSRLVFFKMGYGDQGTSVCRSGNPFQSRNSRLISYPLTNNYYLQHQHS
jgi:hypothetical protein